MPKLKNVPTGRQIVLIGTVAATGRHREGDPKPHVLVELMTNDHDPHGERFLHVALPADKPVFVVPPVDPGDYE